MTAFGQELERLRGEKQVTTKEVARGVGIPQSRYRELEKGVRVPTEGQLQRLENYYGVASGSLAGLWESQ